MRKLQTLALDLSDQPLPTPPPSSLGDPFLVPVSAVNTDIDSEAVTEFIDSKRGKACLRGEWRHDKSVSSAYWDPRGRSIVSTSYDDSLRCKFAASDLIFVFIQSLNSVGYRARQVRKLRTFPFISTLQSNST